ncbi:hypothetical protein FJT64_015619 [Amphibalanus amphitrite]|uniref:Uncharacterized protein n=1 Tax=Amphibalanus amphitrite TaxID=1232801 RepID=A0A6A4X2G4_AMPAM|nr:hypothetical protein FJT64_015619 [Amphibalanus amphitrite]
MSGQGAEPRAMEALPDVRQGHKGHAALLQGENGAGVRLCSGQDRHGLPLVPRVARIPGLSEGGRRRGVVRRKPENIRHQKGVPARRADTDEQRRDPVEGLHDLREQHQPHHRRENGHGTHPGTRERQARGARDGERDSGH